MDDLENLSTCLTIDKDKYEAVIQQLSVLIEELEVVREEMTKMALLS